MILNTENIKIKDGNQWIPFIGVNTGETVLYQIQRDIEGNFKLVGTDGSVSTIPFASLRIGEHVYNGTSEVNIEVYDGEISDEEMSALLQLMHEEYQMQLLTDDRDAMQMTLINSDQPNQMQMKIAGSDEMQMSIS